VDKNTHLGRWWVPSNPRRRVFGVLQTPPNEDISLTVAGGLEGESSDVTILGRTQDDESVTLLRCLPLATRGMGAFTHRPQDVASQDFFVHEALFGGRFKSDDDARFRFTEVDYANLAEWIGESTVDLLPRDRDGYQQVIGIKPSKETLVHVGDTEIHFVAGTAENWSPGTATFRSSGGFHLFSESARSLKEWHRQFLGPIGYLISYALGKPCAVTKQSVLRHAPWWTYVKAHKSPPTIRVLRGKPLDSSARTTHRPLFTLSEDGVALEEILPRWLRAWPELELPLDLYFATMYAPFMYMETRFLNLVQAAEGYHRARFPQFVDPPEVHEKRLASIFEDIRDEAHREWLRGQLGEWSNEPRLRSRLRDLLELAKTQGLAMTARDARRFVHDVKTSRDILSHGGLAGRRRATDDLFPLERQLARLLQACLTSELGVSPEVAKRIIDRAV
jgi:hypothetical protein